MKRVDFGRRSNDRADLRSLALFAVPASPSATDSAAPLIGLSTSEMRMPDGVRPTPEGEPPQREMALGMKYVQAIVRAGGAPVVLPPIGRDALETLIDRLSGVCLPGGPDLDPSIYRESPHPRLGPTEPEIDVFELALLHAADERGLPVLAICRGAQALNVARGGSLHQHLPDAVEGDVEHRQTEPDSVPTHAAEIAPRSVLARTLALREVAVNSFHHQAVSRLGRGLRAVAWAPDGVVEAIEASEDRFVVGVQWHAEALTERPEQAALFRSFVAAARGYDIAPACAVA